jgi:hypothetical protein
MNEPRNDVVLNRALLVNPALDSGAIAVRGTVFHVFQESGDHDVTILRGDRVTGRFTVAVQPEGAPPQVNVDLARLEADTGRSGSDTGRYAVREGGVMGFAVGLGVGRYAVLISHIAGGGSRTVLDSRGQIPAGDLFAVTLITPGTYRASNLANRARLQITVAMPRRDEPYSPARPILVRAGDDGFDPAAAHILAGQSVVLLAGTPARFLVEPVPDGTCSPTAGAGR